MKFLKAQLATGEGISCRKKLRGAVYRYVRWNLDIVFTLYGYRYPMRVLFWQCILTQSYGSGILFFLTPRSGTRDRGWKKIWIRDVGRTSQIIFLRAKKQFLGLKILKFFYADPDPGRGINTRISNTAYFTGFLESTFSFFLQDVVERPTSRAVWLAAS